MAQFRILSLTCLAMLAFASNSLLCRLALKDTGIDAASFTSVRLLSAALTLFLVLRFTKKVTTLSGNWPSAVILFIYAAGFSFAYINLTAATGALLLFSSVQMSMIGYGIWKGEVLRPLQMLGLALALAGLLGLVAPGLAAPPLLNAVLMIGAGAAWGIYSLRGRGAGDPTAVTAGNFLRTVPIAIVLSALTFKTVSLDTTGFAYALASGALTSGLGYAIWYRALPGLKATEAAIVQLSVPVIAALGGIILLGENLSLRLILASIAILSGIALVVYRKTASPAKAT